jgi:hypothetical protein
MMLEYQELMYLKPVVDKLLASGLFELSDFEGCSDLEISYIEEVHGLFQSETPAVYKEFLQFMGKQSGSYLSRQSCQLPGVLSNRGSLLGIASLDGLKAFPLWHDGVFFACYDGYHYSFFMSGDNDPEVFSYHENKTVERTGLTRSQWFDSHCFEGIWDQGRTKGL